MALLPPPPTTVKPHPSRQASQQIENDVITVVVVSTFVVGIVVSAHRHPKLRRRSVEGRRSTPFRRLFVNHRVNRFKMQIRRRRLPQLQRKTEET